MIGYVLNAGAIAIVEVALVGGLFLGLPIAIGRLGAISWRQPSVFLVALTAFAGVAATAIALSALIRHGALAAGGAGNLVAGPVLIVLATACYERRRRASR